MAYLKINNIDFSMYCNKLEVSKTANYNAQTNAAGNTVVDLINHKRTIKAGIIPLDSAVMKQLQEVINAFSVIVTYLDPHTGALNSINCIIPENKVDYYTIQADKTLFNAVELEFMEL